MKALILSALIWLGLFTPPSPIVIDGLDGGGVVGTYLSFFDREARTGTSVVLDGACVSACTLFLASFPPERICITHRASLGVHQASTDGLPDPEATILLWSTFYPPWLQEWIAAYQANIGAITTDVVYIRYDELSKHYRTCTTSEAPIAGV